VDVGRACENIYGLCNEALARASQMGVFGSSSSAARATATQHTDTASVRRYRHNHSSCSENSLRLLQLRETTPHTHPHTFRRWVPKNDKGEACTATLTRMRAIPTTPFGRPRCLGLQGCYSPGNKNKNLSWTTKKTARAGDWASSTPESIYIYIYMSVGLNKITPQPG